MAATSLPPPGIPSTPCSACTVDLRDPGPWGGRSLARVNDVELATLVRLRLRLLNSHGWVLLACAGLVLLGAVAVGLLSGSRLVFGATAVAVASGTVGLGFVSERLCYALFAARGRELGLSAAACEEAFSAAADAEHWLRVLGECGQQPTDAEIASFVRGRGAV